MISPTQASPNTAPIPRLFVTTAAGEVRAAHSSRRDAVSKRIDRLAADVAELQRELARIKTERECSLPSVYAPRGCRGSARRARVRGLGRPFTVKGARHR
jgi:hypothetical protein